MKAGVHVLLEILVFGLTYGGVFVIILTYLKLFQRKINKLSIFLPLCIMGFIFIIFIIFEFTWDNGYAGLYVFFVSFIGLGLHVLVFCCIFLLIRCCVKDMTKKIWLWIGLTIICFIPVLYSIYGFIIPTIFKIEKVSFYSDKYNSDTPLKILQLSDVHLGAVYQKKFTKKIVNKILDNNPDIVVITGDLFDDSLEVKESWLEPFKKVKVPIIFSAGNHDCYYEKKDVVSLANKANIIYLNKDKYEYKGVRFVAVDYDEDFEKSLNEMKNQGKLEDDMTNILLVHVPKKPKDLKKFNIFLGLSGHTHNGQVFPGNIFGLIMYDCENGVCDSGGSYTFVNSGIGSTFFPMRTFSRSKISIISINKK